MYQDVIFREYDIRGVYNNQFDKDFAYLLGKAYAKYFSDKTGRSSATISLGYDARISSPEIKIALSRGLTESGFNVLFLGLITSPISYYSTFALPEVDGSIMITGSHNPPDYNGFKICIGRQTLFGEEIQNLLKIIKNNIYLSGSGQEKSFNIFPNYLERYKSEFGQLKPIKVVLDCGNGAAGCIVKNLFNVVGLEPIILFEKPDGSFPNHHPDPTVESNLVELAATVKKHNAVVGIGFDGDADRIGLVDHTGKMIYGDELMVLISRSVLSKNPGAKIIGDVKCSDRLFKDVESRGGQPIMWKTGHSLIKEKIKIEKSPFGGEMSGHVFFADRNYGYDDALYAALRVCEILSQTGKTIPELLSGLPHAYNTPELRIDTTEEKKVLVVQKLKEAFPENSVADYKLNLIDGVRISFKNGWALARASNTQPVLVLRFESDSQAGLQEIQGRIETTVKKYL